MALIKTISQIDSAEPLRKEELYATVAKLLLENVDESYEGISYENIKNLWQNILDDLKKEKENPPLVKLINSLLHNKNLQKFFPESEKEVIFKEVINAIDSSQHENVLVNFFCVLIQMPSFPNVADTVLDDLIQRLDDVLSNKKEPASTYAACNFFQKFLKDYEEKLSNFIPLLSKIVFLPLCHPSNKVRETAEKNLDMFPKILLYSSDEISTSYLLKLLKESYCKEMLQLFKEKQEIFVLKIWTHVVKALGNALSSNLASITPFFQVIEKGFKSPHDEICIASFISWKSLIDNFSSTEGALNDSKRLRFLLKPFKNISRLNENILSAACNTWMHLIWNLAEHLSDRFSEVCIPLLELTVGKISNGLTEKMTQKGGSVLLVKKSCYILLRFLELPPTEAFSRLSSPKKMPHIPYPTLQVPLDIKIITHHFKEILCVVKIIIDTCGMSDDMKTYLDCLMKSVLFVVTTIIECSNKESAEAVYHFFNFLSDIIDTKTYPSQGCLKCLESLSKMSRKVLVSHSFNCGSRKPQDILCNNLLKMLLSSHLFPNEHPKRFFAVYNRLIKAGIRTFQPLSNAHKFMHIIRNIIGAVAVEGDSLIDLWSGIASPLLEVIEKTQEVNQGDKQEHDFSCMYDVLLFPFEFIFPANIHQFRMRPVFKLWTNLYKVFICSANLVSTTSVNEACENFCAKLKNCLKDDVLKEPLFMEFFCVLMQSIMESIDFVSGSTSGAQGLIDASNMIKRKKPLGNLTSFVDLLVILLKVYHAHYVEAEEETAQSCAPAIQRKVHIVKNAAPIDLLKIFFGNIKSGSTVYLALEQLASPISKLFVKSSQKRNLISHSDAKLELLWNVITSSIERYYLGPYDSEFLVHMSPLLEATFSHPKRNIKEKSRRFWFATCGPNTSSLKLPDSLKNLLKKMKLPLLPDDISPTEFSTSPMQDSLPEDSSEINPSTVPLALTKPFKSPVNVNCEVSKSVTKENKQSQKICIDDLPSEEFVKIDSPIVTTPKHRNVRKRRSYVPTLYNDLSQDTATLMSSSESQDTTNSASLEEIAVKELVVEISPKTSFEKEMSSTSLSSQKDESCPLKNVKSPIASKFEERLDECLNKDHKDQSKNVEKDVSASFEINSKTGSKIENKLSIDVARSFLEETDKKNLICDKISVFSKPGEKRSTSRNARKNSRLSQSFSAFTVEKKTDKLESQKLNKSCIELSDSDNIIPSSQSSFETDNGFKLSANNENQKSPLNFSLDVIEKPLQPCLSPENNLQIDDCEDLMIENINMVTSTPSKAKLPSLSIIDEAAETPNKISKTEIDISLSSNNSDVKTCATEKFTVEVTENLYENTISDHNEELNVQKKSKETIKDISNLLDAIDDLVNSTSEKSDPVLKISQHSFCDTEIKNTSESGIKTKDLYPSNIDENNSKVQMNTSNESDKITSQHSSPEPSINADSTNISVLEHKTITSVTSDVQGKIPSNYEPIAKRSRLSLKMSEKCPQNESYNRKLRRKSTNAEFKPQQKSKKKKTMKKDDNLNKNIKNKLKNKKNTNLSMDCKIIESDQACNSAEDEILCNNKQNHIESKNSKDFENIELKIPLSKIINKENIDNAIQLSDKYNKTPSQNTENAESCEIFEANCNSSEDSLNSHCPPHSDEDKSNDMNILENEISLKQNDAFHTSTSKVDNTNATEITVIPCSLENDIGPCLSNEVANIEVEKSNAQSNTSKNKTNANDEEVDSSLSSVRFSAIEDDLSCEMHHIVDCVINNEKNINVHFHENDSVTVQTVENVQNSSISEISPDKENITCDKNKSYFLINEANKNNDIESKLNQNQLSHDYKENICDSLENYNSSDVIMSNNTDDSESSVQILVNPTQDLNQSDLNCSKEIVIEKTKSNDVAEKPVSENDAISPELDHSYSFKSNEDDELIINKLEDNSNSSDEIDVVTIHPNDTYNASFPNLNIQRQEVSCLMKDLVVTVEKIDIGNYCSVNKNLENIVKTEVKNFSLPDSNHAANKENENMSSNNDNKLAKGSKRRKIKPPIRSPFNFRQRAKMENSKKNTTKSIKTLNITQIKSISESKDLVIKSLFSKEDIIDDETDNSMTKIISSIVDSITVEDDMKADMLPHIPSSSHTFKLSNDELTDLNTRMNAQVTHQTRRMKVITDSHTSTEINEESIHSNVTTENSEEPSTNLSSILKKRKAPGELSPKKVRKVTFASPLIHELVFDSCSESRAIDTVTMNRIQNLNKKRKKILQEKNKTGKTSSIKPTVSNESEDIPSSSEYQDSDVLDFNDLPVSPALINCPDDISNILKDLTSESWIRGLESLLASKNIKTIGDVCKLNIHQVKALPFKSPKVVTLHKALIAYIGATQETTLQKFKTIDDGSFIEMNDTITSHSAENSKEEKIEEYPEENYPVLLEEAIKDTLKKDCLKKLPLDLLAQLIEACAKAVREKIQ